MTFEELRLKAIQVARDEGAMGAGLIARAEEIFQWLRYGSDGATDLRKTLDGITLTNAKTGETMPARVIGKGGDIIDRLRKQDGYDHE